MLAPKLKLAPQNYFPGAGASCFDASFVNAERSKIERFSPVFLRNV